MKARGVVLTSEKSRKRINNSEMFLIVSKTCFLLFLYTDPPRINPFEPIRALVPGEDLILTCIARGGPEPTITWYKDRKLIHKGQTLQVITNETSAMEGLYTCRASNGIQPDDIASVTVTSLGK